MYQGGSAQGSRRCRAGSRTTTSAEDDRTTAPEHSSGTACASPAKLAAMLKPAPADHEPASILVEGGRHLFPVARAEVGLAAAKCDQLAVPVEQVPVRVRLWLRPVEFRAEERLRALGVGHLGTVR